MEHLYKIAALLLAFAAGFGTYHVIHKSSCQKNVKIQSQDNLVHNDGLIRDAGGVLGNLW